MLKVTFLMRKTYLKVTFLMPQIQPHYEGCVLVYQYGRDYSKCNNQGIYTDNIDYKLCKLRGQCK